MTVRIRYSEIGAGWKEITADMPEAIVAASSAERADWLGRQIPAKWSALIWEPAK